MRSKYHRTKRVALISQVFALLALAGCGGGGENQTNLAAAHASASAHAPTPATATAPAPVATAICGNASVLTGPSAPPPGAIRVPAGNNKDFDFSPKDQTAPTFWFEPGTHILASGIYTHITPTDNSTFIGAPGAILDGRNDNLYAFVGQAKGVTIEYLTIQNFGPATYVQGGNNNSKEGVVNHDAGHGWTIQYNTVQRNAGAGVFVGTSNTVKYNCLTNNGQYGFSAYEDAGVSNVVIDHNEISYNNTFNWETIDPDCGCTGGGKFWATNTATVTNNWFHGNHQGPGLWADTNNNDFDIENNVFSDEESSGIIYETSYNALIKNNLFQRTANSEGPKNPFPTGAIYISESGGDSRVAARYKTISITNNTFIDNWSGVVIYENADRFCNSAANTSTGDCTLVNPSVANSSTCIERNKDAPYFSDCRWKSQNVQVSNNVFNFTPTNIGSACTPSNGCGLQGLFSNYGTDPSWSPFKGDLVEQAITFSQANVFSNNTYVGPWQFMAHDQSVILTPAQWQAAPYAQDANSSFH